MTSRSREASLLSRAEQLVRTHISRWQKGAAQEARFQLLEGVASRLGGFDLDDYWKRFGVKPLEPSGNCLRAARNVVEAIAQSKIPSTLAVSGLSREALGDPEKRSSGAYHTDFRLAQHLAARLAPALKPGAAVIDPACGAGMLLAALVLQTCGGDRKLTAEWLAMGVYAADVSPRALRGTLISLSCLTDDLDALEQMRARWLLGDSLLCAPGVWREMAPNGFDAVIANPPWEKVKLTRHEFLRAHGDVRHYGADYADFDAAGYAQSLDKTKRYARAVAGHHASAGVGETDLFVAFTELSLKLVRPGGEAALILPAGLIRSKSTENLRHRMAKATSNLSIEVFENRARFFEIDTRFKFLCVHLRARHFEERASTIELVHGHGVADGVVVEPGVKISRTAIARLRPDLSLPEVRNEGEWKLFRRMAQSGIDWSQPESLWYPDFMREVDMTKDRPHFKTHPTRDALPLVEGRMIHQHRFGAKSHVEGTGRSAVWATKSPGDSCISPQFYMRTDALSSGAKARSVMFRSGFCDITGQTNERSSLAAMIQPGVVCGNKVPTLLFPNDPREERLWLWVAIANSLPFDWLLRRIITTTVNYFHLLSLRLPPIEPDSLPGRKLVEIARELDQRDRAGSDFDNLRQIADLRARADRIVMNAYGLGEPDIACLLADFPLIDGTQPAIRGECRSTVTRDLLLSHSRDRTISIDASLRLAEASAVGAVGYLTAQSVAVSARGMAEIMHG